MYNIGLSTNGKIINEDLFRNYNKSGITHMEITVPYKELNTLDLKTVYDYSKKYNVMLWSYHLPFMPCAKPEYDMSSLSSDKRKKTIDFFYSLIQKGADVGITNFVVHPSCGPVSDEEREDRIKVAMETHSLLGDLAAKEGAILCVENLPRHGLGNHSLELKRIVESNPRLKVCIDTNHFLKEELSDASSNLKEYIHTLHVSDYDYTNEKHWLPGEGTVDWQKFINVLKSADYKGPWLYEVRFEPVKTISRDRYLTTDDFVRNAKEIFENKKLTVLGTPIEL